jgi:hypothetical protein
MALKKLEGTGRRRRRRKQLVDGFKNGRYWNLKGEVLNCLGGENMGLLLDKLRNYYMQYDKHLVDAGIYFDAVVLHAVSTVQQANSFFI